MATPSPRQPIRSNSSTPLTNYPYSLSRKSRGTTPRVQKIGSAPQYLQHYASSPLSDSTLATTSVPSTSDLRPPTFNLPSLTAEPTPSSKKDIALDQTSGSDPFVSSSATTQIPRWSGGPGFGIRHFLDPMPFSLWDATKRTFRFPEKEEWRMLVDEFSAKSVGCYGDLMIVEVESPPHPLPLTVAAVPAIFTPIGKHDDPIPDPIGTTGYLDYRAKDPCPELHIPQYSTPTSTRMLQVMEKLSKLMNFTAVTFLPTSILIELDTEDGRKYPLGSLPPFAAGLNLIYHHSKTPYHTALSKHSRARLLDPSAYIESLGPASAPQDQTNYLDESNGGLLTPGIRISTGPPSGVGQYAEVTQSSTCGVRVKRGNEWLVTASHHSFLAGNDVYHPSDKGEKIGEIVDRYPELDLAFFKLTPAHAKRFANEPYFQAPSPVRISSGTEFTRGTWFEADTMSTGLMTFLFFATRLEKPPRPPGHPKIPFHRWKQNPLCRIFGAVSLEMMPGMCGAPMVEVETGNVAGFFHLASEEYALCAGVEDLIAEGIDLA